MRAARALSNARASLRRSSGQCILIQGPVGIGKTRVLDSLVDRARAIGLLHARGAAHSTRTGAMILRGKPYAALRGMILELFGGTSGDLGEIGMQVQGFLLPGEPNLAPLLNDAIEGLDLPENEDTLAMTIGERARRLSALLRRVFASVTTGCLLAVDNYHTLDNASWALLRACVDMGFLVALAGRPTGARTVELIQLEQLPETIAIDLGPLGRPDALSLLQFEFFGAHAPEHSVVPEPLVHKIHEWAEGNPFWICETVNYLLSHRVVEVSQGLIRIRHKLADEPVPRPIESAIVSVIDALQPQLRVVLKTACVIGRRFAMLQLTRAAHDHFTERQLAGAVQQLARDGMMLRRIERPQTSIADAIDADVEDLLGDDTDDDNDDEHRTGGGGAAMVPAYMQATRNHSSVSASSSEFGSVIQEELRGDGAIAVRRRTLTAWYEFRSTTTFSVILSRMLASQKLLTMARARKNTRLRDTAGSQPDLHRIATGVAVSEEAQDAAAAKVARAKTIEKLKAFSKMTAKFASIGSPTSTATAASRQASQAFMTRSSSNSVLKSASAAVRAKSTAFASAGRGGKMF
jgi:hypothetical protein